MRKLPITIQQHGNSMYDFQCTLRLSPTKHIGLTKEELRPTRKLFGNESISEISRDGPLPQKENVDDDCSIAEEFMNDEEHIAADLARREGEKTYKFPKVTHTPTPKLSLNKMPHLTNDTRQRSISTAAPLQILRPLCSLKKPQKIIVKTPAHSKTLKGVKIVAVKELKTKLETVDERSATISTARISFAAPVKKFPEKNTLGATLTAAVLAQQRMRTNSTDTCNFIAPKLVISKELQHAIGSRNSSVTPSAKYMSHHNTAYISSTHSRLNTELQFKFSALVSKGLHKFNSTAQPQPKNPHSRIELDDRSRILEVEEEPIRQSINFFH